MVYRTCDRQFWFLTFEKKEEKLERKIELKKIWENFYILKFKKLNFKIIKKILYIKSFEWKIISKNKAFKLNFENV